MSEVAGVPGKPQRRCRLFASAELVQDLHPLMPFGQRLFEIG
ncbi:hypothetical protein [Streptomyces lavendulae]